MSVRRSSGFALLTTGALLLAGLLAPTGPALARTVDGVAAASSAPAARAATPDRFERLLARSERARHRPAALHLVRPVAVLKPASAGTAPRGSVNGDVAVPMPKLYSYYDDGRVKWVVKASWRWRNKHWRDGCNDICNRDEGFGIRWTPVLDPTDSTLRKCTRSGDKYPGCWYQTTPKQKNFHGLGYVVHGQVRVHWAPSPMHVDWMRYLGHHGSLVVHIRKPPCGKKFHLISGYSHVWRTTEVTGFSISTSDFGVTFSEETHHWEADSYTGVYRRSC